MILNGWYFGTYFVSSIAMVQQMTPLQIAVSAPHYIDAAKNAGVEITDRNVVDLLADNLYASLEDIREGLRLAGFAAQYPRATAKR